eukprot:1391483-Amorphochlora_amoeboformis.AAC.2
MINTPDKGWVKRLIYYQCNCGKHEGSAQRSNGRDIEAVGDGHVSLRPSSPVGNTMWAGIHVN